MLPLCVAKLIIARLLSAWQKTNTGNYSYSISTITETGPGWLNTGLVSALNSVS